MLAFNEPQKIAAWKSSQSQIKAELTEHVSKLNCVMTITPGVDLGQSCTEQPEYWISSSRQIFLSSLLSSAHFYN